MVSSIVPAGGKNPVHLKGNAGRGERRGFRSGRSRGLGELVVVLSIEQSDTTASSGFMIDEAKRRFLRVSVSASRPMGWVHGSAVQGLSRRELRRERLALKKAALEQSASDAARPLFPSEGLGLETYEPSPSR